MSFLPDRIIDRYYLILKAPLGRPDGSKQERPNEEERKKIENWLLKNFTNFPHIPDLFFENYSSQKKSKKTPLDIFSSIQYELLRLEKFKLLILQNLDSLKNQFNTIIIDKSKYNINPSSDSNALPTFLLDNIPLSLEQLFFKQGGRYHFFPNFIKYGFFANNNNLFNYTGSSPKTPFFSKIFNDNYNGETKEFIIKLFKEYIQIRNSLIKKIEKYYGIIAFKPIFDFQTEDIISIMKKSKIENSFNKNFQEPKIFNEVKLNIEENSNYNSSYEAFLSSQGLNNNEFKRKNKLTNEQKLKLENSYKFMRLRPSDNIYQNIGNENILDFSNRENIKTIFEKLCNNLKNIYNIQFIDLYQLMNYSIELDFYSIQFIFNFVRPDLFLNALKIKKEIYRFINKNIDLYYDYIEDFDIWIYNYLLNYQIDPFGTGDKKFEEVYQTFYNFILNMFDKSKSERNNDFINQLNNEGIFIDIENPNSKSLLSEEELQEYKDLIKALQNSNSNN